MSRSTRAGEAAGCMILASLLLTSLLLWGLLFMVLGWRLATFLVVAGMVALWVSTGPAVRK